MAGNITTIHEFNKQFKTTIPNQIARAFGFKNKTKIKWIIKDGKLYCEEKI